jgi:formiminotetrahydrofolate cyclodeaminase
LKISEKKCTDFVAQLHSNEPVPGGGGAAALVGAIGTALGGMVASLTTGKKKYAEFEEDIQRILGETERLEKKLLDQIDQDAINFAPLAKAYGLPTGTEEEKAHKAKTLEECTKVACQAPIEIVRLCYDAILIHEELVDKGSALAISDVACGVQCLKAALYCGWVNVLINISTLKDQEFVKKVEDELKPMIAKGAALCDEIFEKVENQLSA